jgi:DNA polymerase III delta prime subunit
MKFDFRRTLGQNDAKERLSKALATGRFPHALLVHGEPGLGQHALLLDLAQILSCEGAEHKPCGTCFPCRAFDASALETLHYLIPVLKRDKEKVREVDSVRENEDENKGENEDEEGPESGQLDELVESMGQWHANPYGYGVPEKAIVRMSQVRGLIGRLRFSEAAGRARIVLVPRLEALHQETANALLKTLEEPPANVYFLIASDHRSGLMQTLLSRCLHLGLSPLPPDALRTAAETLSSRAGKPHSTRLLPFAEGSPGAYLTLLENEGEELLEEALRFLSAAVSDWRVFADYAAESAPGAAGLEHTARLLHFLLRMLRAHQVLRFKHPGGPDATGGSRAGEADGYRWTAAALEREGWDASLAAHLGAFEDIADPQAFALFLEAAHRAVREYSKPSIALTGLFLEYEAKIVRGIAA